MNDEPKVGEIVISNRVIYMSNGHVFAFDGDQITRLTDPDAQQSTETEKELQV